MSDTYTIVVGVSETSWSPVALQWAMAQAAKFGGRVVAVRVWRPEAMANAALSTADLTVVDGNLKSGVERRLADDVAAVLGPDHAVTLKVVEGGRRSVLVEESRDADLLVIDAPRGVNVKGSVFARRLMYRAHCPVVVMPPEVNHSEAPWARRLAQVIGRDIVRGSTTEDTGDDMLMKPY